MRGDRALVNNCRRTRHRLHGARGRFPDLDRTGRREGTESKREEGERQGRAQDALCWPERTTDVV